MKKTTLLIFILVLVLVACSNEEDQPIPTLAPVAEISDTTNETAVSNPDNTQTNPETVVEADTVVPPTATPSEPLAATVNGQPIFLADYEQELARYERGQAEVGNDALDPRYGQIVLDALIEKALIEQAAAEQGIVITPEMVDQEIARLRQEAGEPGNFEAWLEANYWTEEEFRQQLPADMAISQMVAIVTANVPSVAEQVQARIIQLNDPDLANTLLTQIRNGDDFAFLAQQHSLHTVSAQEGGDLGFFAQGSLLVPEVEAAAFALPNPGDVSEVVPVTNADGTTTYYLVQLVERDPQRPLPAEMQVPLLEDTFQRWITGLWQNATVEKMVQ